MAGQGAKALAADGIPDTRSAIAASSDNVGPVCGERDGWNPSDVSCELVEGLAGGSIPDSGDAVIAGRGHTCAIGRERQKSDRPGVAGEREGGRSSVGITKPNCIVIARDRNLGAIR